MDKETVTSLKAFNDTFHRIDELEMLIEFLATHYTLAEIYATPAIPISYEEVQAHKIKQIPIKIQHWSFSKPEVLEFRGFANIYFDKFLNLLEKFKNKEETAETKLEKLNTLKERVADLKTYHYPENRFSVIGDTKTKLLLEKNQYDDISITATDYTINPDTVLNEFTLRAEFFYELEIRINREIDKLNLFLNSDISIVVKNKRAKHLVYEIVAVLTNSDYFNIPISEVEKIENRLFTLLKLEKPQKRSKEIGHLNNNKDKIRHLREIVAAYPETHKLK